MAAAAAYQAGVPGQYTFIEGFVWCACGSRFLVLDQDGLMNHIAKENKVGTAQ